MIELFKFAFFRAGKFQCKSSSCIDEQQLCDGQAQCPDADDETEDNCFALPCSFPNFKCKYGACILSIFKCDGKNDCVDGSDELENICVFNNTSNDQTGYNNFVPQIVSHFPPAISRPVLTTRPPKFHLTLPPPRHMPAAPATIISSSQGKQKGKTNTETYRNIIKLQINATENLLKILKLLIGDSEGLIDKVSAESTVDSRFMVDPDSTTQSSTNSHEIMGRQMRDQGV